MTRSIVAFWVSRCQAEEFASAAPMLERFYAPTVAIVGLAVCLLMPVTVLSEIYPLPAAPDSVIGAPLTVSASRAETLLEIARRHGLGYEDIVRANPKVDPWLPEDGTEISLPSQFVLPDAPRRGLVLNLAEYRLYYYPAASGDAIPMVKTYPISIGRMDWATPLGTTRITQKSLNPTWYPPESVRQEHADDGDYLPRVVPPGPDNPLGRHALRLALPGYLIHGTNKPAGVGMRVTHGCLRLFPEDIEALFGEVAVGSEVRIVDQPIKLGWLGDELLLEVHPQLQSLTVTENGETPAEEPGNGQRETAEAGSAIEPVSDELEVAPEDNYGLTALTRAIVEATKNRRADIDWDLAESVFSRADGVPVSVGRLRATDAAAAKKTPRLARRFNANL